MALIDNIYDESAKFFEKWETELKNAIQKFLAKEFVIEEDKVVARSENWISLSKIDALADEEKAKQFIEDNLQAILEDTFERYSNYQNYDEDFVKSFLDRFKGEGNEITNKYFVQLRNRVLRMVIEGKPFSEIRDLIGDSNVGLSVFAENAYARYERGLSDVMRKRAGLVYAVYEGGLIKSSRGFCRERDGKIFHESEIELWRTMEWDGKNDNYNPFTDCGGHNCRHRLNWVSETVANYLRDEE